MVIKMINWGRTIVTVAMILPMLLLAACGGYEVTVRGEEYGGLGETFTSGDSGVVYIPVSGGEYSICIEMEPCKYVYVPEGTVIPVQPD